MATFRLQRARNGRRGSHSRNFYILAKAQPNRLPDRGYFAEADPKEPVRPALGGAENVDPRKRGGRYTSDFIWNTNWSEQMDYEEAMAREAEERKTKPAEAESGFLNLNRAMDLDDMSVDLSAKLKPRERPAAREEASTSNGAATVARDMEAETGQPKERRRRRKTAGPGVYAARPPTAGEAKKWERSGRYRRRSAVVPADPSTLDPEQQAAIAKEREAYERLKSRYQLWTLVSAGTSFALAYSFYTKDVAFSYLAGAAAGFLYLRMLSRSVEGVGGGAAVSQPRLLIPIILALGYNRWNELQAGAVGIHAELLPMLTGFFTYKISVVFCQGFDLLRELTMPAQSQSSPAEPAPDDGDGVAVGDSGLAGSFDATSVDRAFAKRILTG